MSTLVYTTTDDYPSTVPLLRENQARTVRSGCRLTSPQIRIEWAGVGWRSRLIPDLSSTPGVSAGLSDADAPAGLRPWPGRDEVSAPAAHGASMALDLHLKAVPALAHDARRAVAQEIARTHFGQDS